MLALCALWRPPRAVLVVRTQCCARLPDSHPDQWTSVTRSPPCTPVTCWSCSDLGDRVCLCAFCPLGYHGTLHQGVMCALLRPLISMGWEGSWLLSMCFFPHVPRSWPILCAVGPCFPPEVALAAGFLSASASHVVTARQAPGGEKWNRLSGEIQANARKVPIHHPLEWCCPPGLEPTHMAEGSTVCSRPG